MTTIVVIVALPAGYLLSSQGKVNYGYYCGLGDKPSQNNSKDRASNGTFSK